MDNERFYNLFINRPERIGLSEPVLKGKEASVSIEFGEIVGYLDEHLSKHDAHGVGAYAVSEEGTSLWGCYDFDSKTSDPAIDANYALQSLRRAGLNGVIEISRSGEGRHVWVFMDEAVPADELRKCLLLVDEAAALECSEINPKQRVGTDHTKNLGNYVRLPYHARWIDEGRMVCLDDDGNYMSLDQFLDHAEKTKVSTQRVLELAQRYHPRPPPRREVPVDDGKRKRAGVATQDAHLIMRGEAVVHDGGFYDGRNHKLWNLANYLANHPGYNRDEGHALMERVWHEQLEQDPDHISMDICRSMIDRAYDAVEG